MKKILSMLLSGLLIVSVAGCEKNNNNDNNNNTSAIKASDYETDAEFITIADLPPNPLSADALALYKALGFNTMILTEDNATFTQGGVITENYKTAIKNIGDSGLDVWIRNMYNDPDYFYNTDATKERSNYGTPYTIEARNITTELQAYPQITGYYMADEPFMTSDLPLAKYGKTYASMDQYQKLIEWKNTYAPDAFWHMNMVPSKSTDHYPDNKTYKDFIQYYVENIVKNINAGCGRSICLDNYPFIDGAEDEISASYLVDLLTAATVTRDYNEVADSGKQATFGICLQTFKDTAAKLRYPNSANEITFQLYTGMAMGAELFEYFCYGSLTSFGLYGIVGEDGKATDEYAIVKQANERTFGFSKVVCNFDWYNLLLSQAENSASIENAESFQTATGLVNDKKGVLQSYSSQFDAIIGCFNKGDTDGYMIVNYSVPSKNQSNVVKLNFGSRYSRAIVWTENGASVVGLLNGEYRTTLTAGGAAFIVPVA